jgi:hypothetical protein
VAPIIYRILFDDTVLDAEAVRRLAGELFTEARVPELQA